MMQTSEKGKECQKKNRVRSFIPRSGRGRRPVKTKQTKRSCGACSNIQLKTPYPVSHLALFPFRKHSPTFVGRKAYEAEDQNFKAALELEERDGEAPSYTNRTDLTDSTSLTRLNSARVGVEFTFSQRKEAP
ncbi:hypothetical protein RJT34_07239 [Clitoria ternatea]|uniref:Uncharacterized protein n=1 Tax=Clitoria ternatea TaxID=43366 RepID=A0AAN9PU42_CLITE